MNEILGSVWWLIVSLGVLVTFHEFGHYWVARRCGVRVLRFSVGFGRPLWSRRGRDGVEYVVAAIPLGGYVKMLDERETPVAPAEQSEAFNRQPVLRRMAIVAAGPIANLLLCVALLWLMFVIGRPDFAPVVGHADGLAAQAGLERGDTVTAVDGRPTPTWTDVQMALIPTALDRRDVPVRIERADGGEATRALALSRLPSAIDERRVLDAIGLAGRHDLVAARVGRIEPNTPAAGVLREGDLVTAIDGSPVGAWSDIPSLVERLGERGGTAMVEVDREGERLALELAPRRIARDSGEAAWVLGIAAAQPAPPERDAVLRHGPIEAIPAALNETVQQTRELVAMIGRAFSGRVAVQNTVAGPVTIARAANAYADLGVAWFLTMLAMLSLSLGILNLLPIPILDGGHLLYYLIELAKGSPVSERAMAAGQYVGLALIAGLMGLAFYNDIVNNLVR
ncbi:RIP metalloprotease RseP [Cognatilysobacter bugurensis]|uniref:Zinc metalloprotease n=1 Tax=Cognatilysobacter bugurensis TaxID=543356 RepID=A0A918SZQ2_9GAMM|nr:RIP metalloprotease RseP [Lysobacter bugurensis]GHA75467.1 zinc metalloprotease [Lysobacter bugurensis]